MFKQSGLALLILALVTLTGCATTGGGITLAGNQSPVLEDVGKILDLLANNPIIVKANVDADQTTAWVDEQEKAGMEPLKVALARACPSAVKAATSDLKAKIELLKARLAGVGAGGGLVTGYLIYDATRLKYGGAGRLDPKAEIEQIRSDIALRMDALFTGCVHLFPKEQVRDMLRLAAKAGIVTQTGGLIGLGL